MFNLVLHSLAAKLFHVFGICREFPSICFQELQSSAIGDRFWPDLRPRRPPGFGTLNFEASASDAAAQSRPLLRGGTPNQRTGNGTPASVTGRSLQPWRESRQLACRLESENRRVLQPEI